MSQEITRQENETLTDEVEDPNQWSTTEQVGESTYHGLVRGTLERLCIREEKRLQNFLWRLIETMPRFILDMNIGDLLDAAEGLVPVRFTGKKGRGATFVGSDSAHHRDSLTGLTNQHFLAMLEWVATFLAIDLGFDGNSLANEDQSQTEQVVGAGTEGEEKTRRHGKFPIASGV